MNVVSGVPFVECDTVRDDARAEGEMPDWPAAAPAELIVGRWRRESEGAVVGECRLDLLDRAPGRLKRGLRGEPQPERELDLQA